MTLALFRHPYWEILFQASALNLFFKRCTGDNSPCLDATLTCFRT